MFQEGGGSGSIDFAMHSNQACRHLFEYYDTR